METKSVKVLARNIAEEHFWEIVEKIVERKQSKVNERGTEGKTKSVSASINA